MMVRWITRRRPESRGALPSDACSEQNRIQFQRQARQTVAQPGERYGLLNAATPETVVPVLPLTFSA